MNDNKLVINQDKTHLMVMGGKKFVEQRKQVTMMAGEFCLHPTETEKLLGGIDPPIPKMEPSFSRQ